MGFFSQPSERTTIRNASTGQIATHNPQLEQSVGLAMKGNGPRMTKHSVGQPATHRPLLVQRVASTAGISIIRFIRFISPLAA